MNWRQAVAGLFGGGQKSTPEGAPHGAPYQLPVSGGWLGPEGDSINWWQNGYDPRGTMPSATVDACVSAYAQTVAMLPGNHWRLEDDGGRVRQKGSALTRWHRKPNAYQSISDFYLNLVSRAFYDGNGYAVAIRNARFEIVELHIMTKGRPLVGPSGEVFYELWGNEVVERMIGPRFVAPARDVLHVRFHTPEHPLKGVSPIMATAMAAAATNAAIRQQILFFRNQSKPSFVLSTDMTLTAAQVQDLRQRWDEQAKGMATGGTPILTAGLKPVPMTGVSATDSKLIEMMDMSDKQVANVFRVPLVMLGLGTATMGSTESLMQFWLASGLGFVLNHVEEAIGLLFELKGQPDEYLELDTQALLRPQYKDRIESLAKSVTSGLHSPDEGRGELELPKVPGGYGEEPRVQQQVVPLSAWDKQPPATPASAAEAEQQDGPPVDGELGDEDEDGDPAEAPTERAYDEPPTEEQDSLRAFFRDELAR